MTNHTYRGSKRISYSVILTAVLLIGVMCAADVTAGAPANLDPSFGGNGIVISPYTTEHDYTYSIAVQADGKILIAGLGWDAAFSLVSSYIVRHLPNGELDTTFGVGGKLILPYVQGNGEYRYRVVMQPDGKILACGGKENGSVSDTDFAAFRYNSNGTPDLSFGTDGRSVVPITGAYDESYDLVLQPDGKIVLFGYSQISGSGFDFSVARLNANGSLDTTFDSDGKATITVGTGADYPGKVLLQPDGKIVLVGTTTGNAGQDGALVRLNSNGSRDTSFGMNGVVVHSTAAGDDLAFDADLQADGKIVTAGGETLGGSGTDVGTAIVRYNANGSVDTSFATNGVFRTELGFFAGNAIAIQDDGKIVGFGFGAASPAASASSEVREAARNKLLPGARRTASLARLVQTDESTAGAVWGYGMLRLNSNGSPDLSFGPAGRVLLAVGTSHNDYGFELVLQPDGKILAAGVTHTSTTGDNATVRYMGDSSVPQRAPFDFDGDGKTDISIFRPAGFEWWYIGSLDSQVRAFQFGSSGTPVPFDYTGDTRTDIAVWDFFTGQWHVLRSENNTYYSFPFGTGGDVAVPADYDGDGAADPAIYRPATSTWYLPLSGEGTIVFRQFGISTDAAVPADYDGDGKADIAIWRRSAGEWWYLRSSDEQVRAFQFGTQNDRAVPGDYTGDGKSDIAFWRPSNGNWFVLRSDDSSYYSVPFGIETDLPAPGDYDGDGKYDTTVFRQQTGTWYSNRSSAGLMFVGFGSGGDYPVPFYVVR